MARTLIVEDNEMNRDMLSRRPEKRGYDINRLVSKIEALLRPEA